MHPLYNFQVLIFNGGIIKSGGHHENVKLQMGDYHLSTHMFVINIGGCDIVLGVEWLRTLRLITMDIKDLYMTFVKESHTHFLQGIKVNPPEVICSHHMEKILKKGHYGVIT